MTPIIYGDEGISLPSRGLLQHTVSDHVGRGEPFGLILCDVDRFKLINYSLGH